MKRPVFAGPTKVCVLCRRHYPHDSRHFAADRHQNDGMESRCKLCTALLGHCKNQARKVNGRPADGYTLGRAAVDEWRDGGHKGPHPYHGAGTQLRRNRPVDPYLASPAKPRARGAGRP